ncbi:TPA: dATP/dGTP pyrophosphohydrolase domain-containing protein [Salmonella enterica subsp. enterica serovar Orion]
MLPTEEAAELARIALASLEREQVRREHAEWSDKTFGDVGPVGPLKHLSKEALEAAAEPDDLSEWADMQFLLWDAQRRAGISDGEITAAMEEKLKVNMARQWPEPKDGEPRLHIKEQPVPVVPEERPSLNNGIVGFDEGWNACRAAMLQGAEPVSQTYNLPELIEGMEVSIDVSTCDADAGNRYFGTVTEISELYTAKNGYILLVQDAEPNFDVNGNSPVTPDSWISCSERMPEQGAYISAVSKHGEYVAGQVIDDWLDLHDGTSFGLDEVYLWMMLPPLPASPQQ